MQLGPQLEQALLQQLDCLSQLVRGARLADEAEEAPTTAVSSRLGCVCVCSGLAHRGAWLWAALPTATVTAVLPLLARCYPTGQV